MVGIFADYGQVVARRALPVFEFFQRFRECKAGFDILRIDLQYILEFEPRFFVITRQRRSRGLYCDTLFFDLRRRRRRPGRRGLREIFVGRFGSYKTLFQSALVYTDAGAIDAHYDPSCAHRKVAIQQAQGQNRQHRADRHSDRPQPGTRFRKDKFDCVKKYQGLDGDFADVMLLKQRSGQTRNE